MTNCPKCGSWRIIGPRYRRNESGLDSLWYCCFVCGFEKSEPTRDQEEAMKRLGESTVRWLRAVTP